MIHLINPDDEALRSSVRELLDGAKNLAAISRQIGKSRGTLYKWQSGESSPSVAQLGALAVMLGRTIRIDLGDPDQFEHSEDTTLLLGRVLSNQQRVLEIVRRMEERATVG